MGDVPFYLTSGWDPVLVAIWVVLLPVFIIAAIVSWLRNK